MAFTPNISVFYSLKETFMQRGDSEVNLQIWSWFTSPMNWKYMYYICLWEKQVCKRDSRPVVICNLSFFKLSKKSLFTNYNVSLKSAPMMMLLRFLQSVLPASMTMIWQILKNF